MATRSKSCKKEVHFILYNDAYAIHWKLVYFWRFRKRNGKIVLVAWNVIKLSKKDLTWDVWSAHFTGPFHRTGECPDGALQRYQQSSTCICIHIQLSNPIGGDWTLDSSQCC